MSAVPRAMEGLVCNFATLPGPEASPDGRPGALTNRPVAEGIPGVTLVDEFTRECLAIQVGRSLGTRRVIAVLERVFAGHGLPEWLRSDNGLEFIAVAVKQWVAERGSKPRYIDPGCPWQNAYGESFNGRLRDECLNLQLFANRREAAFVIEALRRE